MAIDRLIRPGVQIQQNFVQTNPQLTNPELPTVVVGVCNQIVRDAEGGSYDKDYAPLAMAYPGLEDGAVVDQASVRLRLADVLLEVYDNADQVSLAADKAVLEPGAVSDFVTAGVKRGDEILLERTITPAPPALPYVVRFTARVLNVDSPTQLTLDRDLSVVPEFAPPAAIDFCVHRAHGTVRLPHDEMRLADVPTLNPPEVTTVINGGTDSKVQLAGAVATLFPAVGADNFVNAAVMAGDKLNVFSAGLTYTATILSVDGANQVTLNANLEAAAGSGQLTFTVERVHTHTFAPVADVEAASITMAANLTVDGLPLKNARVLVSYKALRTSVADVLNVINGASDISGKLIAGTTTDIEPENPLAVGAFLAKANTVSSVLAMGVSEDSALGWLSALERLETEPVYTIVCLTQDPIVAGFLKTHVTGMSMKEKSRFRIGLINLGNPVEANVVDAIVGATFRRVTVGLVKTVSLIAPTATFKDAGVRVGDFIKLDESAGAIPTGNADLEGYFKVTAIPNNTTLTIENARYDRTAPGVFIKSGFILTLPDTTENVADFLDVLDVTVLRALNKDDQAMEIAKTASSFNERRITYVTNGEVVLNVRRDADATPIDDVVPGWALAAAYGGMNAGFPPHQGFTNMGVVGIKSVRFGNKYYNDSQLGLIGGSGGFVVVQESEASLPAAWLQTTTDNSSIQRRELSVTKTLDYYSLGLKKLLSRFIGVYNIYGTTLTALQNAVDGYHSILKAQNYDKIGSPILSGRIAKLKEHEFLPDTVVLETQVEIPIPLNYILATVEVAG